MSQYKGWVPTVSGRLSFSIFGATSHPRRAVVSNVGDGKTRFIICYQKRTPIDAVLPWKELTARRLLNLENNLWCLCIARCSDDPVCVDSDLSGTLYIFNGRENWKGEVEKRVREDQEKLNDLRKDTEKQIMLESAFDDHFKELKKYLSGKAGFLAEFNLCRNGDLSLRSSEAYELSPTAPTFPEEIEARLTHIAYSLLYFFLRDIAHRHQHHDPHTDTIVDVYKVTDDNDDYSWRSATLRGLLRSILKFKRHRQDSVLANSLGTLAYAKSFKRISIQELEESKCKQYLTNREKLNPVFYYDELKESINAAQSSVSNQWQRNIRNSELFRNLFFGILGVLFALVGLLSLTKYELDNIAHPMLTGIAQWLITDTLLAIGFLGTAIFAVQISNGSIDILGWKPIRGLIRVIQVFKRNIVVTVLSAMGVIFIWNMFRLIFN